jgi:hypothetical protein
VTKYHVAWAAEGDFEVEAGDSGEAVQVALDNILDLEHAEPRVTIHRVGQVKTVALDE